MPRGAVYVRVAVAEWPGEVREPQRGERRLVEQVQRGAADARRLVRKQAAHERFIRQREQRCNASVLLKIVPRLCQRGDKPWGVRARAA